MAKTRFQSGAQMPSLFAESAKVVQARCAERKPAEREVGTRERDAFHLFITVSIGIDSAALMKADNSLSRDS